MEFEYNVHNGIGVYTLSGNLIGEHDGMRLADSFNEEMEEGTLNFVLNLQELKHVNSSGLGVFITLLPRARKKGGELVLVNHSDFIKNLMMITKLSSVFQIFDTLEEAAAALEG